MKPEQEKEFLFNFEKRINALIESNSSFKTKFERISWLLQSESEYWNKNGDDGTLSRMRNFCSSAASIIIDKEINSIKNSDKLLDIKKKELESINNLANSIPWLTEAFKSDINLKLSFASSELKLKTS